MDDAFRSNGSWNPSYSSAFRYLTPQQGLHPQHFQAGQPSPHTLPPLGQQSHYSSVYGQSSNSAPQTPLPPQYIATSSAGNVPPLRPLQPSQYGMPNGNYSSSQQNVNLYPTTSGHGVAPHLAPAPLGGALQELRPMPQGGLSMGHGYTPQLMSQQHGMSNPEPEPIHVVGQQGRRGVLPTTPGRVAPSSAKQPLNPTKNEDNKFECPSCNKTYLHLKHLKRHLLRHTGERPYQCHLCKDTFSRSDILKRHFQKCSIRRGNPTGANHLAHSQAHLRKNRAGAANEQNFIPPMPTTMPYSGTYVPPVGALSGMPMTPDPTQYANGNMQSMSARTSRSNSLIRPGLDEGRRSMSNLELGAAARTNFGIGSDYKPQGLGGMANQGVATFAPQHQTSQVQNSFGYTPPASQIELNSNIVLKSENANASPYLRGGSGQLQGLSSPHNGLNWPNSFNAQPTSIKPEPNHFSPDFQAPNDSSDAMFNTLYSGVGSFGEPNASFETWLSQNSSSSPLQVKVDSLLTYCCPNEQSTNPHNIETLKNILTLDNVQHFVKLYGNFHSHWPILHLPSLRIDSANNSLLMLMICIGAVYSDRIHQDTVRWLVNVTRVAVFSNARILTYATGSPIADFDVGDTDLEEFQSLILLQTILVWHGTPETRTFAREQLAPKVVAITKALSLSQVYPYEHHKSSILHQSGPALELQTLRNAWSWDKWLHQEKKLRAFYFALLFDAAWVIFFNNQPGLNLGEIHLPLPSDDVAFEASNADECANALGINGPELQSRNVSGSRRQKQMYFAEAMKMLQSGQELPVGATNVYSKFILSHALHIQIWYIHRMFLTSSQSIGSSSLQSMGAFPSSSSGASTPASQADWTASDGSISATNSGRATPIDGSLTSPTVYPIQLQHDLKALRTSLDKWKRSWDTDLALHYPPNLPRPGFCRDAIHYYHLANYLLRAKPSEWQHQPEVRMQHTFSLLNQIKSRVASEQDYKGMDRGSVSGVDDAYATTTKLDRGIQKLTLDMKGLFKPLAGDQDNQDPLRP